MIAAVSVVILELQELQRLRGLINDDPKLFTAEVIHRVMLTYRDIQVNIPCGCINVREFYLDVCMHRSDPYLIIMILMVYFITLILCTFTL